MSKRDVVVLGAARSAIGTFSGSLSDIEPAELAGTVMKAAVERSGVDPKAIQYVTVGNQQVLEVTVWLTQNGGIRK